MAKNFTDLYPKGIAIRQLACRTKENVFLALMNSREYEYTARLGIFLLFLVCVTTGLNLPKNIPQLNTYNLCNICILACRVIKQAWYLLMFFKPDILKGDDRRHV